jgi:phage terminase large subunit-like protein
LEDVQELVTFLGFHKHRSVFTGSLAEYLWFEEEDYKSYSGA